MVTRFRLGTNVPMHIKEAYFKVKIPDCYHQSGYVHLKELPSYVQTKAQRDAEKARSETLMQEVGK